MLLWTIISVYVLSYDLTIRPRTPLKEHAKIVLERPSTYKSIENAVFPNFHIIPNY